MTREEILSEIKVILQSIRTIDPKNLEGMTEESDFITDLGAPSTELINIIAKAEDHFKVEFEDDDVDEMGSRIGDTIDIIQKTLERQSS